MLSEATRRGWAELEAAAEEAGGYLAPPKYPLVVDYDYRAMSKYAAKKGITSFDLTEEERDMFKYNPPLVYA